MPKLYFKTDQGDRFEILKASHIAFKQGKQDIFCNWEAVPSIHGELDLIFAQAEAMLGRVKNLLESHTGMMTGH